MVYSCSIDSFIARLFTSYITWVLKSLSSFADLTVASVPICNILKLYPDGLKLSKLKEAVKKKCGYDLEVFCYQVGYSDIFSCLQEIPELVINRNKNRNCRVRLKSGKKCNGWTNRCLDK